MKKDFIEEVKKFIKKNNLNDVFIEENDFYKLYGFNFRLYVRVSTELQDFGRQLIEVYEWAKKKNIKIFINHIYCDKYTGKKTDRKEYQKMKSELIKNDFLAITEINRLGRNWENTKKEWEFLKDNDINVIVLDNEMLSAKLPTEQKENITLDYKFIQDIMFSALNYVASKKIEEVAQSTKDGLKNARLNGKKIGRPIGKNATKKVLINTLKLIHEDNYSIAKALNKTRFPRATFFAKIKDYKNILNTEDLEIIIKELEKGEIIQ